MRAAFWLAALSIVCIVSSVSAAEMRVFRDRPYAEPKVARRTLDVYAPAAGQSRPIVFYIHGGGWRRGDKGAVAKKPAALVERGYVFVSTNYRFVPEVDVLQMAGDIAKAIRWTYDHAAEYGGDPNQIFVVGHSAGAHLAALVCTDDRYLKAEGLSLKILRGCVPIDVSVYDIPWRLSESGFAPNPNFTIIFGDDPAKQRDYSPATHVSPGKDIPPFLLFYVASRDDTKAASAAFAERLTQAGVTATVVAGENKTHTSIANDLGTPDDAPTSALLKFLSDNSRR